MTTKECPSAWIAQGNPIVPAGLCGFVAVTPLCSLLSMGKPGVTQLPPARAQAPVLLERVLEPRAGVTLIPDREAGALPGH